MGRRTDAGRQVISATHEAALLVWASDLARTREQQIKIIRDLLVHAVGDEMSTDDREFAIAALELLQRRSAA